MLLTINPLASQHTLGQPGTSLLGVSGAQDILLELYNRVTMH